MLVISLMTNGMTEMIDDSSFPNQNAKVHLQVRYCGGWGYEKFYLALREDIDSRYPPNTIEWMPVKDIGNTGAFEITLMDLLPPKLIHSKLTAGLGRCETSEERARLAGILDVYIGYVDKQK